MKTNKNILILILVLPIYLNGQIAIKGKVVDNSNEVLIGANIRVKGRMKPAINNA